MAKEEGDPTCTHLQFQTIVGGFLGPFNYIKQVDKLILDCVSGLPDTINYGESYYSLEDCI